MTTRLRLELPPEASVTVGAEAALDLRLTNVGDERVSDVRVDGSVTSGIQLIGFAQLSALQLDFELHLGVNFIDAHETVNIPIVIFGRTRALAGGAATVRIRVWSASTGGVEGDVAVQVLPAPQAPPSEPAPPTAQMPFPRVPPARPVLS